MKHVSNNFTVFFSVIIILFFLNTIKVISVGIIDVLRCKSDLKTGSRITLHMTKTVLEARV